MCVWPESRITSSRRRAVQQAHQWQAGMRPQSQGWAVALAAGVGWQAAGCQRLQAGSAACGGQLLGAPCFTWTCCQLHATLTAHRLVPHAQAVRRDCQVHVLPADAAGGWTVGAQRPWAPAGQGGATPVRRARALVWQAVHVAPDPCAPPCLMFLQALCASSCRVGISSLHCAAGSTQSCPCGLMHAAHDCLLAHGGPCRATTGR